MKRIIIIITLVMLLKPILPVIEYAINYDYISKVLCVNKEKPKLQCNGKCHLTKELAKLQKMKNPFLPIKKWPPTNSKPCSLRKSNHSK